MSYLLVDQPNERMQGRAIANRIAVPKCPADSRGNVHRLAGITIGFVDVCDIEPQYSVSTRCGGKCLRKLKLADILDQNYRWKLAANPHYKFM